MVSPASLACHGQNYTADNGEEWNLLEGTGT